MLQDPAFGQALQRCGTRPIILASGQLLLQRRIFGVPVAMLPRAAPPRDIHVQLADIGLARVPLLLSPETPVARKLGLPIWSAQTMAVLPLLGDLDRQFAALHAKWRNQLRAARRRDLRVALRRLPPDRHHPLLVMDAKQGKERGYRGWPAALTAAFAAVAPAQTQLFVAKHRGQILAQMLFLTHGQRATYHIGHTNEDGRRLSAHNLLMWEAMRHFTTHGFQQIDLGPLHPATPGLNRFKERTGAKVQKTGGTWLDWKPFRPMRAA